MNTAQAFWRAQLSTSEVKVFDWNRAARLIKDNNVKTASAGLKGDWEWTGGTIFVYISCFKSCNASNHN